MKIPYTAEESYNILMTALCEAYPILSYNDDNWYNQNIARKALDDLYQLVLKNNNIKEVKND